jgi:hypothetical protein
MTRESIGWFDVEVIKEDELLGLNDLVKINPSYLKIIKGYTCPCSE